MTPKAETTKREVIRKAYGENWDKVKDYVDGDGWCHKRKKIMFEQIKSDIEIICDHPNLLYPFRPKSILGIENNSGWIRIEPDGSNLPKNEEDVYYRCHPWGSPISTAISGRGIRLLHKDGRCTHYKPIEEVKPPLY